ncbi:MAG: DUF5107 domain-containing protein [Anaerorhabdus sp.]
MSVKIWEEDVIIPTYEVGEPDKNPMFLEKRVYQGSSGKVYPYPTIESISNEKTDKVYRAVYLENDYLKIMVLPELGGRIQRAIDKTNDYDFVYYNHVIKPALVGLVGPWISGGIEFNWPQHHRPTTFMEVEYTIKENNDGSMSLLLNDVDQMYGTKAITSFTLFPSKAYLEVNGQLYNGTPFAQTFLWWANPAVLVHDETQSIFPKDVHNVYDHGKRDVSSFPIATSYYYKHDYSKGVDISRYKNIPVPTSYMAEKSDFDFVGGYDYKKQAGILHVADHHISPGKKQWTWGNGEFGQAWDRNLTDEDGPYIELMTGVYTDNQPDFTWLKPYEEKTFKQYFMPYKDVGEVSNATINATLHTSYISNQLKIVVYATDTYNECNIKVNLKGETLVNEIANISPYKTFCKSYLLENIVESDIKVEIIHQDKTLVEYQASTPTIEKLADPAVAPKHPKEVMSIEELYLIGQHIEQYRHATLLPDIYYEEGLLRDENDTRINTAMGFLNLRRGVFKKAEDYFNTAFTRLTKLNPNPYNSECIYGLGLTYFYQGKYDLAFDNFYKATWTSEQQEMSFYYLALISARKCKWDEALDFINKSLVKNAHHIKARGLKGSILRKLNEIESAIKWNKETLAIDTFDYLTNIEMIFLDQKNAKENLLKLLGKNQFRLLEIAYQYEDYGMYQEAITTLNYIEQIDALGYYHLGYSYLMLDDKATAKAMMSKANECASNTTFPNHLEDIKCLEAAMKLNEKEAKACYYLGNLYYDKLQHEKAISCWEKSYSLDDTFATVQRNLSIAYYNKRNNISLARQMIENAFELNKSDARVFLEMDQLHKKLGVTFQERLNNFIKNKKLITMRDDLYIEYVTLLNECNQSDLAYDATCKFHFTPWEGAEGKITTQYKIALCNLAISSLLEKDYVRAKEYIEKALVYPINLGEGKLEGTKDNHLYYFLGLACNGLNLLDEAKANFKKATLGEEEIKGVLYYYDQPADMILFQGLAHIMLNDKEAANRKFYKLLDYGKRHLNDEINLDFFAVSLPDFLIYEVDQTQKNKAHCNYVLALAYIGLKNYEEAEKYLNQTIDIEYPHQHSHLYFEWMKFFKLGDSHE